MKVIIRCNETFVQKSAQKHLGSDERNAQFPCGAKACNSRNDKSTPKYANFPNNLAFIYKLLLSILFVQTII